MIKLEVTPQHGKGPGINIYGPHVTPHVWRLFMTSINANHMHDPFYVARQKAGAFFQGGSDNENGKWVFIEFWKPDTATEYVELVQSYLDHMTDEGTFKELSVTYIDDKELERIEWNCSFYETTLTVDKDKKTCTLTPKEIQQLIMLVDMHKANKVVIN